MRVFMFGGTGQAWLCQHLLVAQGHSIPFVFDAKQKTVPWEGSELFSDETKLKERALTCDAFIVGIGGPRGWLRSQISERFLDFGLPPISALSPASFIGDTCKVGSGLQAMPHATINQFSTIGRWCILNTNCHVDHESIIGDGVHIMGGAAVAGTVRIGDYSTIGTNATILPNLTIGRNAFVGAGTVVTKNVPDNMIVIGVPARPYKELPPLVPITHFSN